MGRPRSRRRTTRPTDAAHTPPHAATATQPAVAGDQPVPFRAYVRASKGDQDESCDQQLAVAEPELHALGHLPATVRLPREHAPEAGVYVDHGVSAWKVPLQERCGAAQLLADLEQNQQPMNAPGVLWVWALSRLLRPEDGAPEAVAQLYKLRKLGWVVHVHRHGRLDVMGRDALVNVFRIALESEKDAAHSREKEDLVRRGKDFQRRAGVWCGGFAPYGYERWSARLDGPADPLSGRAPRIEWIKRLADQERNGVRGAVTLLCPAEHTADRVRALFRLAADGQDGRAVSIQELVRWLNDAGVAPPKGGTHWGRNTVNLLLKNETYVAIQRDTAGEGFPALWEALVDTGTWERVQARLARNAAQRRGVNTDFTLSGLLFCARCGARLVGERQPRRGEGGGHLDYYRASPSPTRGVPCGGCRRRIPAERLEPAVLAAVAEIADHDVVRRAVRAEEVARRAGHAGVAARRDALDARARDVRRKVANLVALVEQGGAVAAGADARIAELNAEAKRIDGERRALDAEGADAAAETFASRAAGFAAVWAAAGPAERKDALRCFVTRIEVDRERGALRVAVRRPIGVPDEAQVPCPRGGAAARRAPRLGR